MVMGLLTFHQLGTCDPEAGYRNTDMICFQLADNQSCEKTFGTKRSLRVSKKVITMSADVGDIVQGCPLRLGASHADG